MDIFTYEDKRLLKSKRVDNLDFIEHAFSTRDFGNLGLHVGDVSEHVLENRRKFAAALNIDYKDLVSSKQIHGDKIVRVNMDDVGKGATNYEKSIENCDGLITNIPNLPLFAFYADCVPVFLVDPVKKAIGIVHSGWKGTLYNISGNAIKAFIKEFKSRPKDIIAVIGPYICQGCYEVSDDIIKKFKESGFIEDADVFFNKLDLGNIIKKQLLDRGLVNIEKTEYCTSCNIDIFFSHRKENGKTGRMAGIIMIKGD